MSYTYTTKNGFVTREKITCASLEYKDDMESVYKKVTELAETYGIPIKEFSLSTESEYDSHTWCIDFVRPATPEEIDIYVARHQASEKRRDESEKQEYERLKKKFEK